MLLKFQWIDFNLTILVVSVLVLLHHSCGIWFACFLLLKKSFENFFLWLHISSVLYVFHGYLKRLFILLLFAYKVLHVFIKSSMLIVLFRYSCCSFFFYQFLREKYGHFPL